ncbi:MAG: DUF7107 domain-containing protein [Thermomicrobiales bacterium]
MDGRQFDEISRRLASASSRRTLLKGALIGLVSGIGGASRARPADAARAPRQAHGLACTRATDCASFLCVDGVCCDSPCMGQCESCATGTCQPVAGVPVGNRPACLGDGHCAAMCDGVTTSRCAGAPGADVACGESTCADGWLTTHACGGNGACVPTTTSCAPYGCAADGTSCATGCTSHDQCPGDAYCADGRCVGDQPLGAPCADGAACLHGYCVNGVCCNESCDGACRACDLPGNEGFCTEIGDNEPCAGGTCCDGECVDTHSSLEHCGACDVACPRFACHDMVCAGGVCDAQPLPDNSPCDDGDACTQTDMCRQGVCVGGDPVVCQPLDQCHVAGTCEPATGGCSNPNKPDNVSCNDGNACTDGDTCQAGVCTGGAPLACTTDNPCLIASCDPDRGCVSTPKGEGVSCADADTCDGEEACDGEGNCVDGTPVTCGECTVCDAASGMCQPANDNDPCTPPPSSNLCHTGWVCGGGQCLHQYETVCLAEDECHTAGSCDPATGLCSFVDAADDTPCDVTNKCILDRTCQAGVCSGGFHRDPCGLSLDFCGTGGHCDPWTGTCVDRTPVNDGMECTNIIADACTVAQKCQGGVCTNIYRDCSELADQCNDGVCDPSDGNCYKVPKSDDTHCDYVDDCGATEGICQQGACALKTPDGLCGDPLSPCLNRFRCRWIDDLLVACEEKTYKEDGEPCGANKSCQDGGTCECNSSYADCGGLCRDQDVWCACELCGPSDVCCRRENETYCGVGGFFPCAI